MKAKMKIFYRISPNNRCSSLISQKEWYGRGQRVAHPFISALFF
jgi:hypothetical protein